MPGEVSGKNERPRRDRKRLDDSMEKGRGKPGIYLISLGRN